MDGQPLDKANVSLVPVGEGDLAYGQTDAQGICVIQTIQGAGGAGTTLGEYIITVRKAVPTGYMQVEEHVPALYRSETTSPLRLTVTPGRNAFAFDLDSRAR